MFMRSLGDTFWKSLAPTPMFFLLAITGATGEAAQETVGCLMGGALTNCPQVAQVKWWIGTWATRMTAPEGVKVTAYTMLNPNGTYATTLDYDDGHKVVHWGRYRITYPDGTASIRKAVVKVKEETVEIEQSVRTSTFAKEQLVDLMAAAPPAEGSTCDCASGRISYYIEGSSPDLNFPSPQVFRFMQQAAYGYVRVWGPGVEGRLGRLYAKR
jgi:hypothetical protein